MSEPKTKRVTLRCSRCGHEKTVDQDTIREDFYVLCLGCGRTLPIVFSPKMTWEAKKLLRQLERQLETVTRSKPPPLAPREPDKCTALQWVVPGEWPGELFLPVQNMLRQAAAVIGAARSYAPLPWRRDGRR